MLKAIRLVQSGAIELREIVDSDELIPPTPEEFDLIKSNVEERIFPYEAYLTGVIKSSAILHLRGWGDLRTVY
jgi:hypothetical protein